MTMVLCWQKFSKFCHYLWAVSSGVVSSTLWWERKKVSDYNVADAVVPGVLLLPLRHWVTAVPAASAGALCLVWWLPRCSRGRKLDSKLTLQSDSFLLPYLSVEECQKDHSWRCHTQMAAKCLEYFSKLDQNHQTRKIKLFIPKVLI